MNIQLPERRLKKDKTFPHHINKRLNEQCFFIAFLLLFKAQPMGQEILNVQRGAIANDPPHLLLLQNAWGSNGHPLVSFAWPSSFARLPPHSLPSERIPNPFSLCRPSLLSTQPPTLLTLLSPAFMNKIPSQNHIHLTTPYVCFIYTDTTYYMLCCMSMLYI